MFSKKGFTVLESVIAVGLLSVIAAGGTGVGILFLNAQKKSQANEGIIQMREAIVNSLRGSDTLALSAADPVNAAVPNINCLRSQQNCGVASTAYTDISVIDRDGNYLTRHDVANWGFGLDGRTCTTFSTSRLCPFRFTVEWKSLCNSLIPDTCITPQLVARGTLTVDPTFTIPLNMRAFNFEITLYPLVGTYEQACTSIGGTYLTGPPPSCRLRGTTDCGVVAGIQQVMVGYDAVLHAPICASYFGAGPSGPLAGQCNVDTQVMMGIDVNGNPICKNIVVPPPPGPTPIPYCLAFPTDPLCTTPNPPPATDGGCCGDGGCGGGGDGGC